MLIRNPTCGCGEEAICNEIALDCHPCCRCIPQRLCATFHAADCACDGTSLLMFIDDNNEYSGSLTCYDEAMDLRVLLHHADGRCYWRVVSETFAIDELFEIDGTEGRTCESPILQITAPFYECSGSVSIRPHRYLSIPNVLDDNGCPERLCESCSCLCDCLCITFSDQDDCSKTVQACFDEVDNVWRASISCEYEPIEITIRLQRNAANGNCELALETSLGDGDPIPLSDCTHINVDWLLTLEDYSEVLIIASCLECDQCSVNVPCCPRPLPRTLYATFESVDCPCVENFTLELHWQRLDLLPVPTECGVEIAGDPEIWGWASSSFSLGGRDCELVHDRYLTVAPCGEGACEDEGVRFILCTPMCTYQDGIDRGTFCIPKTCSPIYHSLHCDCGIYEAELLGYYITITE